MAWVGVVARHIRLEGDPQLTELGLRDYAERTRVKRMIEAEYKQRLGRKLFGKLEKALAGLAAKDA